jgi:hypothetical protein
MALRPDAQIYVSLGNSDAARMGKTGVQTAKSRTARTAAFGRLQRVVLLKITLGEWQLTDQ